MARRHSTMRAMIDALSALDERAKFHAAFTKGVAAGLEASGLNSDHTRKATDTDDGFWAFDSDRRSIWRRS